jgi:hypothetical protein
LTELYYEYEILIEVIETSGRLESSNEKSINVRKSGYYSTLFYLLLRKEVIPLMSFLFL